MDYAWYVFVCLQSAAAAAAVGHHVPYDKICSWFVESDFIVFFLFIQTRFVFNAPLGGTTLSHFRPRFAYMLGNGGHARSQGGRQPAPAKHRLVGLYWYIYDMPCMLRHVWCCTQWMPYPILRGWERFKPVTLLSKLEHHTHRAHPECFVSVECITRTPACSKSSGNYERIVPWMMAETQSNVRRVVRQYY